MNANKSQRCLCVRNSNRDGAALSMVMIVMFICSIVGIALINLSGNSAVENSRRIQSSQTIWVAEAGLHHAIGKILKDATYRDNPIALSDTIGRGTYDVSVSKAGQTYTLIATGTVQNTSRSLQQVISLDDNSWHQTFLDFAYYGDAQNLLVNDSDICGDVFQDGNVMIVNGGRISCGLVYATGIVTGNGTPGNPDDLDPYPTMPALDTSYYDAELALAASIGVSGWSGTVNLNGGDMYVDGSVDTCRINGPGRLIATDQVSLCDDGEIDDDVVIICDQVDISSEEWEIGDRSVIYGASLVKLQQGDYDDDDDDEYTLDETVVISPGKVEIKDGVEVNGIIYAGDEFLVDNDSSVNGSVVAYRSGGIKNDSEITHDPAEFPASVPPGLPTGLSEDATVTVTSWSEQ